MQAISQSSRLVLFPDVSWVDRVHAQTFIRIPAERQPQSFADIGCIRRGANENSLIGKQRAESREYILRRKTNVLDHLREDDQVELATLRPGRDLCEFKRSKVM